MCPVWCGGQVRVMPMSVLWMQLHVYHGRCSAAVHVVVVVLRWKDESDRLLPTP